MIKIGEFKIIQTPHCYELRETCEVISESGDLSEKKTRVRVRYYSSLKSALVKLLDRKTGKRGGVSQVINKLEECTRRIEDACEGLK